MQVTWLYTGEDGRSHFADLDIPLQFAGHGSDSVAIPTLQTVLSEVPVGAQIGLHPARRRQLIIYLSGVVEMECGDGAVRRMQAGDILLADDVGAEGHRTRDLEGPRRCVHVWLSPDFDPSAWRMPS